MLAWGMLSFGEGYNKSGNWDTGMQTLRWNTEYLLKTFKPDATSTAASTGAEFYIVYQVSFCLGVWRRSAPLCLLPATLAISCQALSKTSKQAHTL